MTLKRIFRYIQLLEEKVVKGKYRHLKYKCVKLMWKSYHVLVRYGNVLKKCKNSILPSVSTKYVLRDIMFTSVPYLERLQRDKLRQGVPEKFRPQLLSLYGFIAPEYGHAKSLAYLGKLYYSKVSRYLTEEECIGQLVDLLKKEGYYEKEGKTQ